MKTCTICKENKKLEDFSKNKNAKDGYRNQCKLCRREQRNKSYSNHAMRKCRGCLKEKYLIHFEKIKNKSYSWTCIDCKNECYHKYNTKQIKACTTCHSIFPADSFGPGNGEYNTRGQCKKCQWRPSKEYRNEYNKIFRRKNKKQYNNYQKTWRNRNKEKLKEIQQKYRSKPEYKQANKRYRNRRYKNNTEYKITVCIRSRLLSAIKQNTKAGSAIKELGCSIKELKLYLESKFYDNPETGESMSWKNHTQEGWHIDHIKPLASFDLTNYEELKKACHYTNLQPLWAKENRSKGDKIDYKN